MGYKFIKTGCKQCGHIWILLANRGINNLEYWAWLALIGYEHIVIKKKIKHDDENN